MLVVQHDEQDGPGRFAAPLAEHLELDVRRAHRGDDLPGDLSGHDGLLVLGGHMAAWEDDVAPWLPRTRALLAESVHRGLPTLGVCLGAQLLALATGGRAARGGAGLEVGLVDVGLLPAADGDALLGGQLAVGGPSLAAVQWHEDAVTELPPGAVLLASSRRYPHQAFRLGGTTWGVQYHPEVTQEDFAGWMRDEGASAAAAGHDPDDVLRAVAEAEPALADLGRRHAEAFAAVVTASAGPAVGTRG